MNNHHSTIYSKLRDSSKSKSKISLETYEEDKSSKEKHDYIKVDLKCSPVKNKSNTFAGLNSMFEYKTPVKEKSYKNENTRFDCFGNKICNTN